MKRKLLLILPMFLLAFVSNAQHTWDFSNAAVFDKGTTGYTGTTVADGLSIVAASSSGFAKLGTANLNTPAKEFPDGYTGRTYALVQKGTVSGNMPSAKYFTFPITAGCGSVKIWYGGSSIGRNVVVTDGANLIGTTPNVAVGSTGYVHKIDYTASNERNIYVYASNDLWIFKIEWIADTPSLGTDSFQADASATVYANGNQVFVSNVKSATTVSVYSVNGALVKTVDTTADTNFDLASGVWIVKTKSAEGEKSVKLLVK